MTVEVERTFELAAPREDVWEFISDPERRAAPISVVKDYEETGDRTAIWHVQIPVPMVDRTIAIETRDTDRREPEYVRFVGRSKVLNVVGGHELEAVEGGTRLTNRFTVDGKLPGVERFFKKNLDAELDNLEAAIQRDLGARA